jgi:hypothetical protein
MGISCPIFSDNSSLESSLGEWMNRAKFESKRTFIYSPTELSNELSSKQIGPEMTISNFLPCHLIGSGLRGVAAKGLAFIVGWLGELFLQSLPHDVGRHGQRKREMARGIPLNERSLTRAFNDAGFVPRELHGLGQPRSALRVKRVGAPRPQRRAMGRAGRVVPHWLGKHPDSQARKLQGAFKRTERR